jgi:potassium efflux system protein
MKVPSRQCPSARFVAFAALLFLPLAPWSGGAAQEPAPPVRPPVESAKDAPASPPLTIERIDAVLKDLESAGDLEEEERKKARNLLTMARKRLETSIEYANRAKAYEADIEAAPRKAREIREALALPAAPAAGPLAGLPEGAAIADLELSSAQSKAELLQAKNRLETLEGELRELATRPQDARAEIDESRKKLEEIDAEMEAPPSAGEHALSKAAQDIFLQVRKRIRGAQIAMLEQELLSHDARVGLRQAERDLAARQVEMLVAPSEALENLLNQRRRDEALAAKREAERIQREAETKHPIIQKLAEQITILNTERIEVLRKTARAGSDLEWLRKQRKNTEDDYLQAQLQLQAADIGDALGLLMRQQRKRLPAVLRESRAKARIWRDDLSRSVSRQFENEWELRDLRGDLNLVLQRLMAAEVGPQVPQEEREEIATELRKLLTDKRDTLGELDKAYADYRPALRDIDATEKDLTQAVSKYARLLDERLLWIPNARPPGWATARKALLSLRWLLSPVQWSEAVVAAWSDFRERPEWPIAASVGLMLLLAGRFRMRRRLDEISAFVGRPNTDSFALTLRALLLTALLSAPLAAAMAFLGWRLAASPSSSSFAPAVGAGLLAVSVFAFMMRLLFLLCRGKGVADAHFRWRERSLKLLRHNLYWLYTLVLVVAFIVNVVEHQPDENHIDGLGRLAFAVGMVAVALFVKRVFNPTSGIPEHALARYPNGWLSRLRYLWYPLAVGVPLSLAAISFFGYHYAALQLEHRLMMTVWLVAFATIGHGLAIRWLLVAQRRLALEKARERRENEQREAAERKTAGDGITDAIQPIEIPEVDISTINEQSRKLLRTLVGLSVVVGLWLTWAGVLPALAVLGEVRLWSYTVAGEGGVGVLRWVTLEHVALALVAGILTAAAAKNLPGVLEIVVLKNLPLEAASRYAITTICQYVLVGVGVVFIFNTVGIRWSQVQWLVAALSVGLGFGLQEIIANFVCGIILLFERPIRIGDIVTVGEVSGVVSRIRIRATTITNWDRKEFIVPNKEFITGRLLNWTLSDTINRLTIRVGVAYGSDTRLARELLLSAAGSHPSVLKDPAPVAFLEEFGASTLNMTLHCFLPELSKRWEVTNDLNQAIDRAFKEAGIEIAFPQLDIHVRGAPQPVDFEPFQGRG